MVLKRKSYWTRQIEICKAVADPKVRTILVPAGNGVGKSFLGAGLALWYLFTHPQSKVVTTGPTFDQLTAILWANIFGSYYGSELSGQARDIQKPPKLEIEKEWFAVGINPDNIEAASGYHCSNLLALVDESSALTSDKQAAINSWDPAKRIYLGNPIRPDGPFYEMCTRARLDPDPATVLIRIPSTESPAVIAGQRRSPDGFVGLDWLDDRRRDYGEGSPWWLSHVEAQFPDTAEGQLFDRNWIDQCIYGTPPNREVMTTESCGPLVMAVDIASGRGGDSSTILVRDNLGVLELESSNNTPIDDWARKAANMAMRYGIPPFRVIYDATGMGETFDILLANAGLKGAVGFQGGHGTSAKYENLRSATYWALRRRLNPSVTPETFHIPPHIGTRMRKELQATTYSMTAKDKIAIAKKDDIIAKIGHSPDFADSLMMSFAMVDC